MSVDNCRVVVNTLSDGTIAELRGLLANVDSDTPELPKRSRRNNRCEHGFIDRGKGRCWLCDPSVAEQGSGKKARAV